MQKQLKASTAQIDNQVSRIKSSLSGIGKIIAGLGIGSMLYSAGKKAIEYARFQNIIC